MRIEALENWLPASAIVTLLSTIAAFGLLPFTHMSSVPSAAVLMMWFWFILAVASCFLLYDTLGMMASGERRPLANLVSRLGSSRIAHIYVGCWLFALNLYVFGIIKPQLGQLVAFSADPLLADADQMILGTDAWKLLSWFNHPLMEQVYHQGWFIWIAAVFIWALCSRPSPEKDRLIISYFLLWSLFGPVVHLLLPAAGPVFFESLGYGDRFAGLHQSIQSQRIAQYLWQGYTHKVFNAGGGISAMPSLHIATMVWTMIALRNSRWFAFAILLNIYMFFGSIVIGWHYAVDGIVGGAGAVICYAMASYALRLKVLTTRRSQAASFAE